MEKMNYQMFKNEVAEIIKDYLPGEYRDATVSIATVNEIGMTHDSLTVRPEGQMISPAANLNAFFEEYENGRSFESVMDEMADVLQIKAPEMMKDMNWLLDYEKVKEHLFIRVSNAAKNENLISSAPHKKVDDLIITCHIAVDSTDHGMASTIVNNDLLEHYGVSEKDLFEDAMKSAPKILPVKIDTMFNVISGMFPSALDDEIPSEDSFPGKDMIIVSNRTNRNGAAALFYPGVMEQLAEKLGGNYVVLPSSIHEVIIIPDKGDYNALESMVADINRNTVDSKEQLSDHAYHYDAADKIFELSQSYSDRIAEKSIDDSEIVEDIDEDMEV